MKYYKFEGVGGRGAGPQIIFKVGSGDPVTNLPLVDPTRTFDDGYWYQLPDDANIEGGKQGDTDFLPTVFVEKDVSEVPYPLDDPGTTQD